MLTFSHLAAAGRGAGLPAATVATCQAACEKAAGCAVCNWHGADRHCHTLSGSVTHAAFARSLKEDAPADAACMLVKA